MKYNVPVIFFFFLENIYILFFTTTEYFGLGHETGGRGGEWKISEGAVARGSLSPSEKFVPAERCVLSSTRERTTIVSPFSSHQMPSVVVSRLHTGPGLFSRNFFSSFPNRLHARVTGRADSTKFPRDFHRGHRCVRP